MLIVYDSMTGNVQRFIDKLGMRNIKIYDGLVVNEPFVLVTYTTGFGQVPKTVEKFLIDNNYNLVAVSGSGNKNWGLNYNKAVKLISKYYNVPILLEFEFSGFNSDIEKFKQGVFNFE